MNTETTETTETTTDPGAAFARTLTDEQIDAACGRELDVMVAGCLGWTEIQEDAYTPTGRAICGTIPGGSLLQSPWGNRRAYIRDYTTTGAATWSLLEECLSRGWSVTVEPAIPVFHRPERVVIDTKATSLSHIEDHIGTGDTLLTALCRAFCKACRAAAMLGAEGEQE